MNTPESDQTVDGTSKFSLDYFNLLEKLLHFEPDESGKLVIPTIDSSDLTIPTGAIKYPIFRKFERPTITFPDR